MLEALGPFYAVRFHPAGADPLPPWRPGSELTSPAGPLIGRIESVRSIFAARTGGNVADVEPKAAASVMHLGMAARLIAPALGAAVLGSPLDMRPGGLWWQDTTGGPVPLSVPGPGLGGGAGSGLVSDEWDQPLLDDLIAPLTDAVARLVPVSGRVLWGNVASAVNTAAAQLAQQRPDLAETAWLAAARLLGSPRLDAERHPPGPGFRRSSCCLFYRLAGRKPRTTAVCGDCVLR